MSDRKQALTDLLAKVEAGEHLPSGLIFEAFGGPEYVGEVRGSRNMSWSDARRFLGSVLPGAQVFNSQESVFGFEVSILHGKNHEQYDGCSKVSFHEAIVIAIIKALIAQVDAA